MVKNIFKLVQRFSSFGKLFQTRVNGATRDTIMTIVGSPYLSGWLSFIVQFLADDAWHARRLSCSKEHLS